jgi:hypothetical protein
MSIASRLGRPDRSPKFRSGLFCGRGKTASFARSARFGGPIEAQKIKTTHFTLKKHSNSFVINKTASKSVSIFVVFPRFLSIFVRKMALFGPETPLCDGSRRSRERRG